MTTARRRLLAATGCAAIALSGLTSTALAAPDGATSPPIVTGAPRTATVDYLLSAMSVDEKLQLVHGGTDPDPHGSAGIILGVPRLGVPDFREADAQGINVYKDATAYPGRLGLAGSFDRDAFSRFGQAVGQEGRALDVDLVYGPQIDLARFPTWQRNMTTNGEDPFVSAEMGQTEINGIQSQGLLSQVKHFAFYDGQNQNATSVVNDQAARQLYLPPYEAAVKQGQVSSLMCSYAIYQIAGFEDQPDYACQNSGGLNDILKAQWDFKGFVTSDYGGSHATSDLLQGMDQEFATSNLTSAKLKPLVDPGSSAFDKRYADALDSADARVLYQYQRFGLLDDSTYPSTAKTGVPPRTASPADGQVDEAAGNRLARELAEETGVLLKNEGSTLPLKRTRKSEIAVVGPTADLMPAAPNGERARGFGQRNNISPLDVLRQDAGNATITYAPGIDRVGKTVPSTALTTTEAGTTAGLTRVETDAEGKVVATTVDATLPGKQAGLVKGHTYTWTGYLNTPAADTYSLWLQRPAGAQTGDPAGYNQGINPGLQQGGGRGAAVNSTLTLDGVAQTLTAPSTILQNTYPNGPTVNGQYLGLDNGGASVPLTKGPHSIKLTYTPATNTAAAPGFRFAWAAHDADVKAAVKAARGASTAVVFVDDANTTTTAGDVGTLGPDQDALVKKVAAANPNTVVVLNTDGAVLMPWLRDVRSVLEMWYPGQEGGTATADLLYGEANPSAKLPMTFPASNKKTPFAGHPERSVGDDGQILWSEGLDMGYRWYVDKGVKPLFPFGHGLSYTKFALSGLTVTPAGDGTVTVSVKVKNTGKKRGATVAQVYVGTAKGLPKSVQQTKRSLVQFARADLEPGASTRLSMTVSARELSSWSTRTQQWVLGSGKRTFKVGTSVSSTPLSKTVTVS
ncbi:beta-glucosidase [Microlunatus sagamiharensis]|uniref:Beta-glucosidase n=1 Tax=Microlunatus sagamiharensis TaxID=546874 RepID=A0A1H2LRU2_9ACTN|nr:glycoside hydrolase family 3 C-terminal domain-containing protein [Microlunatus sagamiharensis]SDU83584.1 beta-glucosidase [Microlunatus sagamiharensis]